MSTLARRRTSRPIVPAIGLVLAFATAACTSAPAQQGGGGGATADAGGDGSEATAGTGEDGDAASGPSACTLLTLDEVQGAVDMVVDDWTASAGEGDADGCSFPVESAEAEGQAGSVEIRVDRTDGPHTFEIIKDNFEGEPISGIGDDAWWAPDVYELATVKGNTVIEIQVVIFEGDAQRDAAKKLAQAALGRV
jgi:hypothetical protein